MSESDSPASAVAGGEPPIDHEVLFNATPNGYLVMTPELRMIEANHQYLRGVGQSAEQLYGRDVFDVFPNSPLRPDVDQAGQVRDSMQRAVRTGTPDVLLAFRYDIPGGDGVSFEPRFWNITNTPVTDHAGSTVLLLHHTEDVTEFVQQREHAAAVTASNARLQQRVELAQADLLARSQELQRANARLRESGEHDRSIAFALQDAMLTRLPEPDHLELVARYLTAADDQIGGDWYDAVATALGTTVVIGDVLGHDIHAATVMGQLRNILRAFVIDRPEDSPAALMSRLDRAMSRLGVADITTAVVLTVSQSAHDAAAGLVRLSWTNAGHPAPLLVNTDGSTEFLDDARALLLGIDPDVARTTAHRTVPTDSILLLYTDGLVETRTEDLDERKTGLATAAGAHRHLKLGELVDNVLSDMITGNPTDDIALLAVRFHPPVHPAP